MGSNLNEALLAGISPPASDGGITKKDRSPPSLPPPLALPVGSASSSPPQSSPPGSSSEERSSDSSKPTPVDPSSSASQAAGENSCGSTKLPDAPGSSALTSPRSSLLPTPPSSSSSSSPIPRGWWGLRRRQMQMRLPVHAAAPPQGRSFNWFHKWKETNRPKAPRLDSVGVEKVIGVYGFSLFGSISLLPSTMDRVKELGLTGEKKTWLMMVFGSIWVLASVGVHCGLYGKTDFEQAVCRHTGRLAMLGLVLLVIFHVRWALPAGTEYNTAFYILAAVAAGLHLISSIANFIVGDDRMEDAAPAEGLH